MNQKIKTHVHNNKKIYVALGSGVVLGATLVSMLPNNIRISASLTISNVISERIHIIED